MTIGLPRALLYHRYGVLWESFFKELNCKVITSGETNKKILEDGINYSIDECCLPAKIYMGHIYSLIGKCNYILVPRIESHGSKSDVCVKFNALYDIVRNTFPGVNLIDYNIEAKKGERERKGFIKMGRFLGSGYIKSLHAYKKAKALQQKHDLLKSKTQEKTMDAFKGLKILIVSHPYNTYDKLIGLPLVNNIKELGGLPVFADLTDKNTSIIKSKEISDSLYWLYNKELVGAIKLYEEKIDGVILLTAFPCGPDSLVNELVLRKSKKIPTINIIMDELQSQAGLQTRIESFMDIIGERLKIKEG